MSTLIRRTVGIVAALSLVVPVTTMGANPRSVNEGGGGSGGSFYCRAEIVGTQHSFYPPHDVTVCQYHYHPIPVDNWDPDYGYLWGCPSWLGSCYHWHMFSWS